MNHPDVLLHICVKLGYSEIQSLYFSTLQDLVASILQNQLFWYLRTQSLFAREIASRSDVCWKTIYISLESFMNSIRTPSGYPYRTAYLPAISIVLEAGYIVRDNMRPVYWANQDLYQFLLGKRKQDEHGTYYGDVLRQEAVAVLTMYLCYPDLYIYLVEPQR